MNDAPSIWRGFSLQQRVQFAWWNRCLVCLFAPLHGEAEE